MRTPLCIAIYFIVLAPACRVAPAQTAVSGPLGVLITPPEAVMIPDASRRALPAGAVARLFRPSQLAPQGEEMIVYDSGHKFEPDSHVAVIKNGKRVADFSVTKLFEKDDVGDSYALCSAAQFTTREKTSAFLAAFRNIGNGAGSIFVLVAYKAGSYQVAWQAWTQQAQLRVRRDGAVQLWESSGDGECTWCPQHYEVRLFAWKNGTAFMQSHFTTKHALNPEAISATPIVIEK